ncbi:MAG: flippase [Bacteroidales bacterium]|nr:flippase [Bacteroidales bacterium]
MGEKSLKYNFILNLVNTMAGLLFPLLTFPYVARILEPDGLGLVTFYQNLIGYITLLSSLGISLYAVREVARVKDDHISRSKVTVEILLLHIALTMLGYLAVGILCLTSERISAHTAVFLVLSISIFFNAVGVNWFYQAMEEFRFITTRSLFFKCLAAIALFVFVKSENDIMAYAIILVVADVGNNILNLLRLRKYISIRAIHRTSLRIMRHIPPALTIFTLNVAISLYVNFSPVILGFVCDNESVGYFAATSRLTTAAMSCVTALAVTLISRMSYYASHKQFEQFNSTASKCLNLVICMTIPIFLGILITSGQLIPVFSGPDFAPAIPTMRIMSASTIFIGIATIVGYQILYPLGNERLLIRSSLIGSIVFFPLCFLLVPRMAQNGAAIAYTATEFTVTAMLFYYSRRYIKYQLFNRANCLCIAAGLAMCGVIVVLRHFVELSDIALLLVEIAVGAVTYIAILSALHHPIAQDISATIKSRITARTHIDN